MLKTTLTLTLTLALSLREEREARRVRGLAIIYRAVMLRISCGR